MIIRKATKLDSTNLINARIDCLKEVFGLTDETEKEIIPQLISYFAREMNQRFIAFLAEVNNAVVSTAFMVISERPANPNFITGKIGTVLNVFTYPEFRRRGFATLVLQELINEARQLNVSLLDLSASPQGVPLYEKL